MSKARPKSFFALHVCWDVAREHCKMSFEKGEIAESDDANRGRGSPKWFYGPRGFSNNAIAAIKQRMEEALSSKDAVRAGLNGWLMSSIFRLAGACYRVMKRLIGANWGKCVTLKDNFNPILRKPSAGAAIFSWSMPRRRRRRRRAPL
jgi:hypothetical protein